MYAGYKAAQTVQESAGAAEFRLKVDAGTIPTNKMVIVQLNAGKFDKDASVKFAVYAGTTTTELSQSRFRPRSTRWT